MPSNDEGLVERGVEVLKRLSVSKVSLSDAAFIAQWVSDARTELRRSEALSAKLKLAEAALEPFDALFRDFVGPVNEEWFDRFATAINSARLALHSIRED